MSITGPADELQLMAAEAVTRLVGRFHSLERTRAIAGGKAPLDRHLWFALAQDGWLGLGVPESLGGAGLSLGHVCVVVERLAEALAPEPFIACMLLPGTLLAGVERNAAGELLGEILRGERLVALAWQERERSLSPAVEETGCQVQRGRLSGVKILVPAADLADEFLVTADTEAGFSVLRVAAGAPGLEIEACRLIDGSTVGRLTFRSVEVDEGAVIAVGESARSALVEAMDCGRAAVAAADLAIARHALAATIEYTAQREQFGQRIASFQVVQHQLVDCRVIIELASAVLRDALAESEEEGLRPATASAAKAAAGNAAMAVLRRAIQLHGAFGYADEADIGLYLKAVLRNLGWLGSPDQHSELFMDAWDRTVQQR
jgi:alkylation response protein AidB-like acyl-CoA dehydrogenase